jgi:hypothetical protein
VRAALAYLESGHKSPLSNSLLFVSFTNFVNVIDYSVELYYFIIKLNYIVELNRG